MSTFMNCRTACAPLTVLLTALAACAGEPSPTAPAVMSKPRFGVGDVITVTNTSGGKDIGSLRWALSYATGGEVIRFAPTLAGQTITLDSTIAIPGKPLTIEGPATGGITISGGGTMRVFDLEIHTEKEVVLRNLTIANGKHDQEAAGIFAHGGGASRLRVENSTITGHVGYNPAISGVSVILVNSTVSGNTSTAMTAPAVIAPTLTLVNSTIAHNASAGVSSGALVLRNSILSNNAAANCTNGSGLNTFEGKNLSDDDACGGPLVLTIADAQLGPLADNGGPTRTHALLAGSPAINAGATCNVAVDQRYAPRDAQCDLGAFEFADFTTVDVSTAANVAVDLNGWAVVTGTIRCSRDEVFDIRVRLHQTQKVGREMVDVDGMGTTPITCTTGVRSWSVSVGANSRSFETGTALVSMSTVNAAPWIAPVSKSQTVKVYRARK